MIRINLLPAREARRRVELRHQFQAAIVVMLAVVGGSVWAYTIQNSELAARQQDLVGVEEEIKRLEEIIKEVRSGMKAARSIGLPIRVCSLDVVNQCIDA